MEWIFILGLIVIVFILLDYYTKHTDKYLAISKCRMPTSYPIVGCIEVLGFRNKNPKENLFKFARRCAHQFAEERSYAVMAFGFHVYETFKLSDIEIILSSTKHVNKSVIYEFLSPFMGNGLLISQGSKWLQRRRILTPTFHFVILQKFLNIFKDESAKFVQNVKEKHINPEGVSLQTIVPRFTLNTICETAMGVAIDDLHRPDEYRNRIHEVGSGTIARLMSPWLFNEKIYAISSAKAKLKKVCAATHEFTTGVIKKRRQLFHEDKSTKSSDNIYERTKKRYAMLDTLLTAEKDGLIDEQGIREEVDTFMFEGYDTTSIGLMFTLFMIAHHQEIQQELYKEQEALLKEKNGNLEGSDYNDLKLLDRVIKESLRLYPPVPFMGRQTTEELYLSETVTLPKTMNIFIHIFDMHRDPMLYENPEKFDPDRFLPEIVAERNPYAYIPFSAGPRNCIGQKFAMLEIKTVVVDIVRNFKLEPITKIEEVVFIADLVLRAKNPIKIRFTSR